MAFSSSSASRCTRSATGGPREDAGAGPRSIVRYCSISDTAAPSTSPAGRPDRPAGVLRPTEPAPAGSPCCGACGSARWSSWKRSRGAPESRSRSSSWSIRRSCRVDERLGAPRQADEAEFTLRRSSACSPASRTAAACTASKARATSPISSWVSTPIGLTRTSGIRPSTSVIRSIVAGRRSRAIWSASCAGCAAGAQRAGDEPPAPPRSAARAGPRRAVAPRGAAGRSRPARPRPRPAAPARRPRPDGSARRSGPRRRPSRPITGGRVSPRAIAVTVRCSMRWRLSTSAPATVDAYRLRVDCNAEVSSSASVAAS